MSEFKCANCGETMYSKCPSMRNIFPTNDHVTSLKNTLVLDLKPYNEGSKFTCLTIEYGCINPKDEQTKQDVFKEFVRRIRSFTDAEIQILLCNHEWYLEEGQVCDLEGHKHNRREVKVNA